MGLVALGEAADAMAGLCLCALFIVLNLQLAIYCDAPGCKNTYVQYRGKLEDEKKTTDYQTIEIFDPLEGISNLLGRKSPPEGQQYLLAIDLVILY
jgi:hypothetical protein